MSGTDRAVSEEQPTFGAVVPPNHPPRQNRLRWGTAWERIRLLTDISGLTYLAAGFLARLPISMLPLGTLVMVVSWTSDVLLGGFAAGTVALCIALTVPLYGLLARSKVLLLCAVCNSLAVLWLISAAITLADSEQGSPVELLSACVAVGATTAPVAALARIRWASQARRLSSRSLLNSSLALESLSDVVGLVLGAAITGILSILWHDHSSLLLVVLINLTAVVLFAVLRLKASHTVTGRPLPEKEQDIRAVRLRLMWLPVAGTGTLGLLLGSMQSSLVSFTVNFDTVGTVGLLYAVLGISSLVAAVIITLLRVRTCTWAAWLLWSSLLTLMGLPVSMPNSVPTMAISLVGEGALVGIALIVTDSVAIGIAPLRMLEVVMTATIGALMGGMALGLTWGAYIGETFGYNAALMLPLISAAGCMVLAHLYGYGWRQHFEEQAVPHRGAGWVRRSMRTERIEEA